MKKGTTEQFLLAGRHGHMLHAGKVQVTIGFVILMGCFWQAPCAEWEWHCFPALYCCRSIVGWWIMKMNAGSSSGVIVGGRCETCLLGQ